MSLLVHDRWTVEVLRLSNEKAHAIWQMLEQYPSLFPDDKRGNPDVWYGLLQQSGLIWMGVYEGTELVGLIYLDMAQLPTAEVHLAFFDRKPVEKVGLLRTLIPIVFQAFPRIRRLTTTVPDIYTWTWKLVQKLGFKWEGTERGAQVIHGKPRDVYIFGLLKEESGELLRKDASTQRNATRTTAA